MKKHTTDLISLVFGIAFVGIAFWWLVSLYLNVRVPHVGWFAAGALIAFGLIGVVASLRGGERREEAPVPAQNGVEESHTPSSAA